jgi:hypothetical protein
MSVLSRFETFMQDIVEGSFGKIFRSRLEPAELSTKLVRAMEDHLQLGPGRHIAPNFYRVLLSDRDFSAFHRYEASLRAELSNALIMAARERNYMLPSRPYIEFIEHSGLTTGETRVECEVRDARLVEPDGTSDGLDETRAMTPEEAVALAHAAQQAQPMEQLPPAWLTLYRPARGQPMRINKPVIHLGRHLSNEVVVNDKRVSRYHAEIRFERGQFVLYDLGSTNGVGINGVMTRQPVPLKNNDLVTVGSHEFVFQRR